MVGVERITTKYYDLSYLYIKKFPYAVQGELISGGLGAPSKFHWTPLPFTASSLHFYCRLDQCVFVLFRVVVQCI